MLISDHESYVEICANVGSDEYNPPMLKYQLLCLELPFLLFVRIGRWWYRFESLIHRLKLAKFENSWIWLKLSNLRYLKLSAGML